MWLRIYDANAYLKGQLLQERDTLALPHFVSALQVCEEPCIVVWDGPNSLKARREVFPDYKAKREPKPSEIYASLNHLKKILRHTRVVQVEVPGYEADDVVATLAVNTDLPVAIYSHDYDFAQLTIIPRIICGATAKGGVDAGDIRLYKTWVGDPSDNIPGVKGFGDKSWETYDHELMEKITLCNESTELAQLIEQLGATPAISKWLTENHDLLQAFWNIVGFLDVPTELIEENTVVGDNNREKAQALLAEYMWVQNDAT